MDSQQQINRVNRDMERARQFRRRYISDALASGGCDAQMAATADETFECGCMISFLEYLKERNARG